MHKHVFKLKSRYFHTKARRTPATTPGGQSGCSLQSRGLLSRLVATASRAGLDHTRTQGSGGACVPDVRPRCRLNQDVLPLGGGCQSGRFPTAAGPAGSGLDRTQGSRSCFCGPQSGNNLSCAGRSSTTARKQSTQARPHLDNRATLRTHKT